MFPGPSGTESTEKGRAEYECRRSGRCRGWQLVDGNRPRGALRRAYRRCKLLGTVVRVLFHMSLSRVCVGVRNKSQGQERIVRWPKRLRLSEG